MTVHSGSTGPPIRANTMEPEVLRQILAGVSAPGVQGAASLFVTQHSTPNMSVDISAGFATIMGTTTVPVQGSYWFYNDALATLAIAASHATLDRIDIVCAQIQDAFYAGASNTPILVVVTGTPAGSPVAPSPPASSIILAQVSVIHASASVLNANITDKRPLASNIARVGAAAATLGSPQTVGAAATVVTGTTVNIPNLPAGRRLRITATLGMTCGTVAVPSAGYLVLDNGAQVGPQGSLSLVAGEVGTSTLVFEITPASGSHVYQIQVTFGFNANNSVSQSWQASGLYVDDVGAA
jgi:hypothetical protein